jgi:hypothetical protein
MLSALVWRKLIIDLYENYMFRTSTNDSLIQTYKFVADTVYSCVIKANVLRCAELADSIVLRSTISTQHFNSAKMYVSTLN